MTDVEDRLDSDYFVSDVAISNDSSGDPDYGNVTILKTVRKFLDDQMKERNNITSLILHKDHPLTVEQQVAVNQEVVAIIRTIRETIDGKIIEISEEV